MTKLELFFNTLWKKYTEKTPQAEKIKQHFLSKGEKVINDHVAFRTFGNDTIGIAALEPLFLEQGYQISGNYRFKQKKLIARSYQHQDPEIPKVFLSELRTNDFSQPFQDIVENLCSQINQNEQYAMDVFFKGCLWAPPHVEDYKILRKESDYASWLSVNGFCANHFTLSANHLKNYGLVDVNEEIKSMGFQLNTVGGEIKGSQDILLEQSATMAHQQEYCFANGHKGKIPTCFYEFIQRYPDKDGHLYQGFRTDNADKIFDSTNL